MNVKLRLPLPLLSLVGHLLLAGFLACGGLLSCSGGESGMPEMLVEDGWVRAMPLLDEAGGAGTNTAAYLLLRNEGDGDDRLTGGETPVAGEVQIHESRVVDDVMRMERLDGVDIPAGGSVELKPGGLHMMLLGLTRPLEEGGEIELTLHFLQSGDVEISLPVRLLGSN